MSTEPENDRAQKFKAITFIKKSNELVEARYRFTLWEIRLFEKMVKEIRHSDTDFKQVDIFIRDFIGEYDKKPNGKLYQEIRKAEELLLNRVVHIPYVDESGENRLKSYPLMAMVDRPQDITGYGKEDGFISLKFNGELSPYLLQLKQRYTQYDPEITMQIDSAYVIRTYELLKLYEYVGSKTVRFDEFREMIGAKEYDGRLKKVLKDTLKTWEHVKQRVLEPAYKEINEKADITFEYEPTYDRKKGVGRKKVSGIRFFNIKSVKDRAKPKEVGESFLAPKGEEFESVYQLMKEYVDSGTVEKWFRDYPLEQIKKGVNYTLNRLKEGQSIRNVGGFLQAMVAVNNLSDPIENQKKVTQEKSKRADVAKEKAAMINSLEQHKENLQASLFEKQCAISLELVDTKPHLKTKLIEKAGSNLFARYDPSVEFSENLKSAPFQAFLVNFVLEEYPRAFQTLLSEYSAMFEAINEQLVSTR